MWVFYYLIKNEKPSSASFSSLYPENPKINRYLTGLFMVRRLLVSLAFVYLTSYPYIQLAIVQMTSLLMLIYSLLNRVEKTEILNEFCILGVSWCSTGLMVGVGEDQIGWMLISILSFNILANLVTVFYSTGLGVAE
jgi:hypothetical protein